MYGTVYGINTPVIHIAHPVPARSIFGINTVAAESINDSSYTRRRRSPLASSTGASKAPAYDHFKNFCGEGIFTADGEDWKAKRAAVVHCLIRGTASAKSDIAQRLEQEANRAADTFLAKVHQFQRFGESDSTTANIVPLLQQSTVGLIYRYITHHDPGWDEDSFAPDADTASLSYTDTTTESLPRERSKGDRRNSLLQDYLKSITRIRMIILAQSRSLWFVLPRWFYSSFSSLYRDEERTLQPIRKFAQQACQCAKPGSPLAQLHSMESHNKSGQNCEFSKDLLDEAITLLFAGQDTSAATLSWTLHLLSIYPDIQSRLANELKSVLIERGNENAETVTITRHAIAKLPFLDAVIKESMRLYPVAPFVVRRIQGEVVIHDQEGSENPKVKSPTRLPAGSVACVWIYGLHRNPKFWHHPDDFLPDRWSAEPRDLGQTNGSYMPFAAGPRNCIGQPIAHVVLRTILARLILALEFRDDRLDEENKRPEDLRIEMQAGFTVLPSGGVTVSIRPRN